MTQLKRDAPRQLWLTPAVRHFLKTYPHTQSARQLNEDIVRALDGTDRKDGCIRFSAPTFLVYILDAAYPGGPERVIVGHGPSDGGAFFKESILDHASSSGLGLT